MEPMPEQDTITNFKNTERNETEQLPTKTIQINKYNTNLTEIKNEQDNTSAF